MCAVQSAAVSAESRGEVRGQRRGHRGSEGQGFFLQNKHFGRDLSSCFTLQREKTPDPWTFTFLFQVMLGHGGRSACSTININTNKPHS